MTTPEATRIIGEYRGFLHDKYFPCTGARAALAQGHIPCHVAHHMACPADDLAILDFLYAFVDLYRRSESPFHSAAIIFCMPEIGSEQQFEELMWQRLQSLSDLDAKNYSYDPRVDADPGSTRFSFSLKQEAFFIIGLHPASSRPSRVFRYPVLAFNPHAQFEQLRATGHYERMKSAIRRRDMDYSGSINPMLDDFGHSPETFQYSGRQHPKGWECPLHIAHGKSNHHPSP